MFQDANTYNATLTIFAQGFMAQRASSLIDWVAPFVPTGLAAGDYKCFDKDAPFQLYDTEIPEGGESPSIHFNASNQLYNCKPNGLKIPISDWSRMQAGKDGYETMRQGKLNTLLSTQLVNREYKGWSTIFNTVTAEGGKGVWKGSPGAANDPIDQLDDLIEAINNQTGSMPKAIAMGLVAWRVLKNHPKVLGRVSGLSKAVTLDDVRGMLVNPEIEIRVGSMPYNSTKLGKAAEKKGIIGSDLIVFHRSDSPTVDDMSAVKTFTVDGIGLAEVHTIPDDKTHQTYDEVLWSEDLRVTAPIAIKRITVS